MHFELNHTSSELFSWLQDENLLGLFSIIPAIPYVTRTHAIVVFLCYLCHW